MSDIVIRVENVSKKYVIGRQRGPSSGDGLRHALQDAFTAPFRKLRSTFASSSSSPTLSPDSPRPTEDFYALRDVSFEVKRGEVLGIIGRNGAGKSTLLKILSRITEPTTGRIGLKGRVASLLEVGTGFHPELTGRENIYLNGAILGMNRAAVRQRFEEIVEFTGVERFLDTPVKRYSSGMYVRLAFGVAAHLESDVLIVDEVLAVGDGEFQKKCLGKMSEVATGGRTVLFVSHNMSAVASLTSKSAVLDGGALIHLGESKAAIDRYDTLTRTGSARTPIGSGVHSTILSVGLVDECDQASDRYTPGQPLRVAVRFKTDGSAGLSLELFLHDAAKHRLGIASLYQFHGQTMPRAAGEYCVVLCLEPLWLAAGLYTCDVTTSVANSNWDHYLSGAILFEVLHSKPGTQAWDFRQELGYGSIALRFAPPRFQLV